MAVYGGNDPEYLKRKKLEGFKKNLPPGVGFRGRYDQHGREYDTKTGKVIEALSRSSYYSDFAEKDSEDEKMHQKKDARMKFGKSWKKFTQDAQNASGNLRPGEVKRYDKKSGKWISNLDNNK